MTYFEELPVSETAHRIAVDMSARYLGDIAMDGVWRATEEQMLNPKGYFAAQRRLGVTNEEFIEQISDGEQPE